MLPLSHIYLLLCAVRCNFCTIYERPVTIQCDRQRLVRWIMRKSWLYKWSLSYMGEVFGYALVWPYLCDYNLVTFKQGLVQMYSIRNHLNIPVQTLRYRMQQMRIFQCHYKSRVLYDRGLQNCTPNYQKINGMHTIMRLIWVLIKYHPAVWHIKLTCCLTSVGIK